MRHYWAMLLLVNGVSLAAVFVFLRAFFAHGLSRGALAVVTGVSGVLAWASSPRPGWTVYWVTGGIENQVSVAVGLLLVARLLVPGPRSRWMGVAEAALLGVFAVAIHELFGLMLLFVLASGTAVAVRVRHRERHRWMAAALAGLVGLCVVALAPGNAIRGETVVSLHAGSVPRALIGNLWEHVPGWIFDPALLSVTLLLVVHERFRALSPPWLAWSVPWRWLVPLVWAACVLVGFLAPTWILGGSIPWRTLDGIHLVFLIGWFISVFVWSRGPPAVRLRAAPRLAASTALGLFALSLVLDGSTRRGMLDVQSRLFPWHRAIRERHEEALERFLEVGRMRGLELRQVGRHQRKSWRLGGLVLPPAPAQPRMFGRYPLTADRGFAANAQFSAFFGLRWVSVSSTGDREDG